MVNPFRLGVFLFCWCAVAQHMTGQWRDPGLIHLGPEQGNISMTFGVTQDYTGFMYFGTDQGLVRYDGHAFTLFAHDPADTTSIGPGDVWDLVTGSDSMIWMASRLSGLNVFDPATGTFSRYATPGAVDLDFDVIHTVFEDPQQQLWLGSNGFRLLLFDRQHKSFRTFVPDWVDAQTNPYRHSISRIFQDVTNPDLLWLSIRDVPSAVTDKNSIYTLASFHKKHKQFKLYPCWGKPCHQDPDGRLWLAATQLNVFDPQGMRCKTIIPSLSPQTIAPTGEFRDLLPVDNGFLVVAPHLIFTMNREGKGKVLEAGDWLGTPMRIAKDRQNNTWIGRSNGVSVLRAGGKQIDFFSLAKYDVTGRIFPGKITYDPYTKSVLVVDHAAGSTKRTVIAVSVDSDTSQVFFKAPTTIGGIAADTRGTIWMYYDSAFHAVSKSSGAMSVQEPGCIGHISNAWTVASNKEGWVGGLGFDMFVWFHETRLRCKAISLDVLQAQSENRRVDFQGLWFVGNNRVLLFSNEIYEVDLVTGKHMQLHIQPSARDYPQADLHSVVVDTGGKYWIATLGMTGQFARKGDSLLLEKTYSTADGMDCAWVHELFPDNRGRIWAFAQNGINVIDPAVDEVRYFSVREGLADACIDPRQVVQLDDDRIATVNGNGVVLFHPDSLWNSFAPQHVPIVFTSIRVAGKTLHSKTNVDQVAHLSLSPTEDYLDIQFQGLAYPTDQNVRYSYLVEGLSDDWISIGENKIVTLSSLRPGRYVLKLKAGEPSVTTHVRTLIIDKAKPITQEAWFILLCVASLMLLAWSMYQWRIRRIREEENAKADIARQMAELELQALRSQMNPHFMFNSLNSIKNYILQASPNVAAEYLSNFAHLIRLILQNSRRKVIPLQEEIETLLLYIELEQIRFDHKFEFSCLADDDIDVTQVMIPPMLLQPFIENAIWHGLMPKKEKGHLLVSFVKTDDRVSCIIEDDGIGRKQAAALKSLSSIKYKSMGMGIIRDRIEIMNKMDALGITADVIDKTDAGGHACGTKVIVQIPAAANVNLN